MSCGCGPNTIRSWYDWPHIPPEDPLSFLANAELVMGGSVDSGQFVNSSTFNVPPARPDLLKIIGGRVIASAGPTTLANLTNPLTTQTVGAADNPDRLEIDFNSVPDAPSIAASTFTVTGIASGPVPGGVAGLTGTTARLQFPAPLPADTYLVQLNGTSTPPVTRSGIALDGEALGLPTGDGVPGGDFLIGVRVIPGSLPAPSPPASLPPTSNWNSSQIAVTAPPVCIALENDNHLAVAEAVQWNFRNLSAWLGANVPVPLNRNLYLRAGSQWRMDIPLSLGYLSYSELQISLLSNVGTRGDNQGTIPAIVFNARTYSGNVTLRVTLRTAGTFGIGIRAIDTSGYYSLFSSTWNATN